MLFHSLVEDVLLPNIIARTRTGTFLLRLALTEGCFTTSTSKVLHLERSSLNRNVKLNSCWRKLEHGEHESMIRGEGKYILSSCKPKVVWHWSFMQHLHWFVSLLPYSWIHTNVLWLSEKKTVRCSNYDTEPHPPMACSKPSGLTL